MLSSESDILDVIKGVSEDDETFPVKEVVIDGVIPHGIYEVVPDYVFGRLKRVILNLVGIQCPPDIHGSIKTEEVHYLPWDPKHGLPPGSVHDCIQAGWKNVGSDADIFRKKSQFSILA